MVQIKFDWSVQLANGYRDPETHIQWKSLLPGHTCQTLFSWFRAQNMVQCPISLPFARRWKNNSFKSSSTGQFVWHIQWKSLLPGHTCQTLFSWFRVQNMVPLTPLLEVPCLEVS